MKNNIKNTNPFINLIFTDMKKTLLSFVVMLLMVAMPAMSAIPYVLGPEGFEGGAIPSGWTQENVRGTAQWTVEGGAGATLATPAGAKSGAYRAAIRGTSGVVEGFVTKLITPAMNLTKSVSPQLVFSHAQVARASYFDTLRVYYRVNATAAWQMLAEYTSPLSSWTTEVLTLPSTIQGSAYQIAFEVSDRAGLGVVLDDVSIFPQSQCQGAFILGVTAGSTSAVVHLASNDPSFEVFAVQSMVTDWANFVPSTDADAYAESGDYDLMLTGLSSYTDYYVYARSVCDDNESGYTDWVYSTFKTTRLVELPYLETFETTEAIQGNTTFAKPVGWTRGGMKSLDVPVVFMGSPNTHKFNMSVDSTNYLAFMGDINTTISPIPADSIVYAVSPEINGNLADCEVDFWGTVYAYLYMGSRQLAGELSVGVMTDPMNFNTFELIETVKVDYAYQFKHFRVSLAGYDGTGKHIALVSMSDKENVFFVDNFQVRAISSAAPTNIKAQNVLPTGFTVVPQLNGADSWNLKVSETYVRDAANLSDGQCLVNQTGITGANYQVQLAESMLAGKTVVIYAQGVKNGVASEWSFPLTLRVPNSGVLPIDLSFNAGAVETFTIRGLGNEVHTPNAVQGVKMLTSPLLSYDLYPQLSSLAPQFDGSYVILNGVDNYIVLPYVSILQGLEVVFRLSAGSAAYADASRVAVGVMTDPYDLTTFTEVARFDGPTDRFLKVRADFANYTGNGHYVAIRALAPQQPNFTYGSHNAIDNLRLQPVSTCVEATGISATPGVRGAQIKWDTNGMTSFLVKVYRDRLHTVLDTSIVKTTAAGATVDSVAVTDLRPSTMYYYSVQTVCGQDTLPLEDIFEFRTKVGVPFKETFESLSQGVPEGWDNSKGSVTDPQMAFTAWMMDGNPGKCMRFDSYMNQRGLDNYLVTPTIMLDVQACQLVFDYKNPSGGNFEVLYALDGDTTNLVPILQNLEAQATYKSMKYDLTHLVGHSIAFYFHAVSNYGNGEAYVYLDNVGIDELDPNCTGMSRLEVDQVGQNDLDIVWAVGGTQEAYIKVTDATTNEVMHEGVATTSPVHIEGLTANTRYNVLGYQVCAEDSITFSFKTLCGPVTIEQFGTESFVSYDALECWTVGIGDTTGTGNSYLNMPYISNTGSMGRVLKLEKPMDYPSYNYYYGNDYYAILPELAIDSIHKYQLTFNASTDAITDTVNIHQLKVGILTDLNDFSRLEIISTLNLSHAADSASMKQYTVPFDGYAGDIYGDYGKYVVFQASAPSNYSTVAYIDNVRIEPVDGCHMVSDLHQVANTSSSVTLEWSGNGETYDLMIVDSMINNPDSAQSYVSYMTGVDTTTITVGKLQAGRTYYAYVRSHCADQTQSKWSSYTIITTAYGIPFLETFDNFTTPYPQADWKVFGWTVPIGSSFTTMGFAPSVESFKMSIQPVDSRISNMESLTARTEVASSNTNGFLQSPAIDLTSVEPGTGVNLTFRAALIPYSAYVNQLTEMTGRLFRVYVSEDGGNTFEAAKAVEWNTFGTGDYNYADLAGFEAQTISVDLSKYAGKSIALGFYSASTEYNPDAALYLDSIAINEYDNSCLAVTKLLAHVEAAGTAVTWKNNTDNLAVEIDLSDAIDFSNIIYHDSLIADSVYFANLAFNTTYYVRVKPACQEKWTSMSFNTLKGLPYLEDFDKKGEFPRDWTCYTGNIFGTNATKSNTWDYTVNPAGTMNTPHTYAYVSTYSDWYSGTKYVREIAMASPKIMLQSEPGYSIDFSFDMGVGTYSDCSYPIDSARSAGHRFGVAIMPESDTAWTVIQEWKDTLHRAFSNVIEKQHFDLSAYANQTVRVAIYAMSDTSASDNAIYYVIDNLSFNHYNASCEAPELTFVDNALTTATVKWNAETGKQYTVELGTTESFSTVLSSATVTDSTYTFNNLQIGKIYYVRAKKQCGAGDASAWSNVLKIRTRCEAIVAYPWSEDFEFFTTGVFEDPCWVNEHISGAGFKSFEISEANNTGENKTKKLALPAMATGTQTMLALPSMNFDSTALYELEISVYRNMSGYYYPNEGVRVFLSDGAYINDDAQMITFLPRNCSMSAPGVSAEMSPGWYTYAITFRASGEKMIVLRGESENGGITYLDNFLLNEYSPTHTIKSASVTGATRTSLRAAWHIINPKVCHDAQVVVSTTELDAAALEAAEKINVVNATECELPGLERETTYYIYVRTQCEGVSGDWAMTSGTTLGLAADVDAQLGDGASSANLVYQSYGNTYSQQIYTAQELQAAGLTAGPIQSVSFKYTGDYSSFSKYQTIYIGTTESDQFTASNISSFRTGLQVVYGPTYHQYKKGWVTYTFNAPYQWDGESNIVIGVLTNGSGSDGSASGWTTAGTPVPGRNIYAYKDYAIIDPNNMEGVNIYRDGIRPNARFGQHYAWDACPTVTDLHAELVGLGINEVRVTWGASNGDYVADYEVYVSEEELSDEALATVVPQYTDIDSLSLYLDTLNAETDYYIYVRTVCDANGHDDGSSRWSLTTITTNATCMPVKDLQVRFVYTNAVVASWTTHMEEQDKSFYYVLSTTELDSAGLAAAQLTPIQEMEVLLDSLAYETTYYLYVQSNCTDEQSKWRMVSFTTPESCQAVTNLHTDRLAPTVVRIAWDHATYAFEDKWEVGLVGVANSTQLVADTFAVLTGLTENTYYTAYVRAICAEGDTSSISTVSFKTKVTALNECVTTSEPGNTCTHSAPFNNYYGNSWTQMIYSAEKVGQEGTINRLSYYCKSVPSYAFTQQSVTIYMANTSMDYAPTTSSWIPADSLVEVYHADNYTHPTAEGWSQIVLDVPFDYEGRNLAVIVAVKNNGYESNLQYSCEYLTSGITLSRQTDGNPSYGEHPGTYTGEMKTHLPVAEFCFVTGGCRCVADMKATSVETETATVSWFPGATESEWAVVMNSTPLTDVELQAAVKDTVTRPVQNLTGLTPATTYFYYAAAICENSYSSWANVQFTTSAVCTSPMNVEVSDVSAYAANVHLTLGADTAAVYQLVYGKADEMDIYDASTYYMLEVTNTDIALTSLLPNTEYKVIVRGKCEDDAFGRWTDAVTFRTECGLLSVFPWIETFDNYEVDAFNAPCWTNTHIAGSGTNVFMVESFTSPQGVVYKGLKLPDNYSGNRVLLTSPQMNFSADQPLAFTIDVYRSLMQASIKKNEGLNIYVSNTPSFDGSTQLIGFIPRDYRVDGYNVTAEDEEKVATYQLAIPAIGEGYILIEGVNEYGKPTYFDNVAIVPMDTTCAGVKGLQFANITTNSVDVSWTTIGSDSVRVSVVNPLGTEIYNTLTDLDHVTISNLSCGTKYRIKVTQVCSNLAVANSITTVYSIPLIEDAENAADWTVTYSSSAPTYYWRRGVADGYGSGQMTGNVFYLELLGSTYSNYSVDSRLTSPLIDVPALESGELLMLDWMIAANGGPSSNSGKKLHSSTSFQVSVCTYNEYGMEEWTALQSWQDVNLSEIPWNDSHNFSIDLTEYAGQKIRLGFKGSSLNADSSAFLALDNIYLRSVHQVIYDANACSSIDFVDNYFNISTEDFVLGTTEYQKMIQGQVGQPDTLVTMTLTVGEATTTEVYDTICEGRLYDRNDVKPFIAESSTMMPVFYISVNGCDSLVNVHIEVRPSQRRDTTIYACKGTVVEVNGKQYYNTTLVSDTLAGAYTCDSIVRTFIQFSQDGDETIKFNYILCAGDTYHNAAFPEGIKAAGDYTAHLTTAYGCDSTIMIHLIEAVDAVAYDTVLIENLPYVYGEDTIVGTNVGVGDLTFSLQGTCGPVTLHLYVSDGTVGLDNISTLQLAIAPNPATVGEPVTIRTSVAFAPDFRLMVFDAVGKLVYNSTEPTLTIPGMPAAGYYTIRLQSDGRQYQAKLLVK